MHKCDQCGTTILFGGVRDGSYRFCKQECRDNASHLFAADELPEEFVAEKTRELYAGPCPNCQGRGPVDLHTAHSVWSALVLTSWKSTPRVCCPSCGTKSKLVAIATSSVLGWWGFPWGLLVTPVQIARNIVGLFATPDPASPSRALTDLVRRQLAEQMMAEGAAHPGRLSA
jgi:hypothetical protein